MQSHVHVEVGTRAAHDPLLARASLEASDTLLGFAKQPDRRRETFLRREWRRKTEQPWSRFESEKRKLIAAGRTPVQATYDAFRLAIANRLLRTAVEEIAMQERSSGLGMSADERAIACGITGTTTVILGAVLAAYTGAAGATVAGAGGQLVGGAIDCGKEAREHAERIAAAQASAAQGVANEATRQLEIEAQRQAVEAGRAAKAAEERTKQITTAAIIGGGAILLLGVSYAIIKL